MSATLDSKLFTDYFAQTDANGVKKPCPMITVPGRTFPVTNLYLDDIMGQLQSKYSREKFAFLHEDYDSRDYLRCEKWFKKETEANGQNPAVEDSPVDNPNRLIPNGLIAATIAHIVQSNQQGAILVFLPGWREIVMVQEFLSRSPLGVDFCDSAKFKIHLIHGEHPEGHADLFAPEAEGCRKIILATNIAETSITIPEVEFVIDSGKHRQMTYNNEDGTSGKLPYISLFSISMLFLFRTFLDSLQAVFEVTAADYCFNLRTQVYMDQQI